VEFLLLKILRLQPSELDKMEFYRVEYLMENLKEWNEKEKNHREKEEADNGFDASSMTSQANSMFKGAQNGMPNITMPSMPSFGNMKF
jgi:hypothetical protein